MENGWKMDGKTVGQSAEYLASDDKNASMIL